jgi:hypothetical protein
MDMNVIVIHPKIEEPSIGDMSFKDSKKGRIMRSNHLFHMSFDIIVVIPSDIPRED